MDLKILEHCDFGQIRTTTDEHGNVLFCASDVAKILGYAKPNNAVTTHCKRYTLKQGIPHPQNPNKKIDMIFIPESDLYRLIIKSNLPLASEFETWICEFVIPSIRKYGMYATDNVLFDHDLLRAATAQLRQAHQQNAHLTHALASMQPHIDYLETIIQSNCAMTITQIGADYGLSAIRLNRILHKAKVHRRVGGQWLLYGKYMNKGLTSSETILIPDVGFVVQTKWTQKGRLLIHDLLTQLGITPNDTAHPMYTGRWEMD